MNRTLPARLVTVTSPEFLLGTRVMLLSFRNHNPWFDGEITVLHRRLDKAAVAQLEQAFPSLSCKTAGETLSMAIDHLVGRFPHLEGRRDRFLSLETMLFRDTRPTLFLDSDVLVRGDMSVLAKSNASLVACPDATILRGRNRDLQTMEEIDGSGEATTFNAGMLLLRNAAFDGQRIERLFACLTPENWQAILSDHTDQAVWNRLFQGEVELADPAYNFMVGHAGLQDIAGKDWDTLRVLHFNGQAKPWMPARHQAAVAQGGLTAWAFEQWRIACSAMLAEQAAK